MKVWTRGTLEWILPEDLSQKKKIEIVRLTERVFGWKIIHHPQSRTDTFELDRGWKVRVWQHQPRFDRNTPLLVLSDCCKYRPLQKAIFSGAGFQVTDYFF